MLKAGLNIINSSDAGRIGISRFLMPYLLHNGFSLLFQFVEVCFGSHIPGTGLPREVQIIVLNKFYWLQSTDEGPSSWGKIY